MRQKMAAEPGLFFKSLAARQTESPEGRWCRDLRTVEHILLRLIKTAEALLSPECSLPRTTSCALRGPLLVSTNGSLLIGAGAWLTDCIIELFYPQRTLK